MTSSRLDEAAESTTARCCLNCFDDPSFRQVVQDKGRSGDCDFCGSERVLTVGADMLADAFEQLLAEYQEVTPGVHYIPEDGDAWDIGETMDVLLEEDQPDLFSDRLSSDDRRRLIQAVLDEIDAELPWEGGSVRDVHAPWTRRGRELWAGAEYDDEVAFRRPPQRWKEFVDHIRSERRFVRDDLQDMVDPRSYLTPALLEQLVRPVRKGDALYRAVLGGVENDGYMTAPHPSARMGGPRPEHCRRGGRVNPPGIPMLYLADDRDTVIAEVRPYKGAPVSVATFVAARDLRVVDFSPRKRSRADADEVTFDPLSLEITDVLNTIGFEMAEPVDPDASEIAYVPTQYVAEVVRAAGFAGVAFKSALGPGTNIVLFQLTDATLTDRQRYKVTEVAYKAEVHDHLLF